MLVGDILLSAREAVPDLPGALPAPVASDITFAAGTQLGAVLAQATYYVKATYTTQWGESAPGPEKAIALGVGQNAIAVGTSPCPYIGVITGINVYLGSQAGGQVFRYSFPVPASGYSGPLFVNGLPANYSLATPPTGNSAYLLDSGGNIVGAQQLFRWLSDALNAIANANGGIPDTCGFATVAGAPNYAVPGDWKLIDGAWYDGYPVQCGTAKAVFRRSALSGAVSQMSYVQVAERLVCELYPQPNRTSGATALTLDMSASDTTAPVGGLAGFVLSFGLVSIGSEIASFVSQNGQLRQLTRGLGGTAPQFWPAGTPVRELNCQFTGYRAPQLYTVGQAALPLRIPSEWTPYIHIYLLARYREVEQQRSEAKQLMDEFHGYLKSATKKRPVVGERQIQPQEEYGPDVRPGLGTFGGILIP